MGLAGALALLAACGPSKPIADGSDGGDDASTSETGASEGGTTDGNTVAMCTIANYAEHPDLTSYAEVGCFPAPAEGECPVCDSACMQEIVPSCLDCGGVDPDSNCSGLCFGYQTLCSERLADQCCYLVTAGPGGLPGRPLREHGVPRLPALRVDETAEAPHDGGPARDRAAAAYRELARYEHASVAAFVEAAAYLRALAAPTALIDAHLMAAEQEAEHARLALAAATSLDGRRASLVDSPEPLPRPELDAFVRDLVRDGCVGERFAAREAAWARTQLDDAPALRGYWQPVERDEAEHAALAWATLEWLLRARPELRSLVTAVLAEVLAEPLALERVEPTTPPVGFGLADPVTQAGLRADVLAHLVAEAQALAA